MVEYSCLASAGVQWAVISITGMVVYRPLLTQNTTSRRKFANAAWTTIFQHSSQKSSSLRDTPSSNWIYITLCFFKPCTSHIVHFIVQQVSQHSNLRGRNGARYNFQSLLCNSVSNIPSLGVYVHPPYQFYHK